MLGCRPQSIQSCFFRPLVRLQQIKLPVGLEGRAAGKSRGAGRETPTPDIPDHSWVVWGFQQIHGLMDRPRGVSVAIWRHSQCLTVSVRLRGHDLAQAVLVNSTTPRRLLLVGVVGCHLGFAEVASKQTEVWAIT
jgi:hypothetical protein